MVPAMRGVSGPGRVVAGRYELLDRIGQGAMGTVWRARDRVLAREVAVKEVRLPDLMPARDRAILRERTLREARVSAKLSHPCVVTVHDVIETDGTPWIVMELVAARSLERVLAEDGPLPPRRVAETGMMLLGALASAHAAGIVHRDVKPGNVLLTRDGRAVLTDFGIAAVDGDPALTQTGMVVGTPGFCAPERIRGAPASPASDLWSLGATLYAAVEGRGPFDGNGSPMAVLTSIVHSDPPPARSAGPLEAVIGALMSKDPAQRPDAARARELLTGAIAALEAAPSAVGAAAGPVSAYAPPRPAKAGPASASDGPGWASASDGPGWASAKTDPAGFPASDEATAMARPGLAALPPGTGPGAFLASAPSEPCARGAGTAQFPAGPGALPVSSRPEPFPASPRPGLFPAAARPALIPAGATMAGPAMGLASLPVSIGAAPLPASAGAGPSPAGTGIPPLPASMGTALLPASIDATPPARMGAAPFPARAGAGTSAGARPADRPAARPLAAPRLLVLGLAGAAVILAGLVWWLVASGAAATAGGPLPAGYRWYTKPAGTAGAPGFTMAAPAGWQAHRRGAATYLRNQASGGIIGVTLTPATAGGPVREARTLERAALAQGTFTGYRRIAITPILLRGRLAGAWRFSYRPPGAGVMQGLVVITQVTAPGGDRPYELMAAAPTASWPQTRDVLAEAARTFSPRA
jgi:eukaryotic-like serine/threonine-protein kinase